MEPTTYIVDLWLPPALLKTLARAADEELSATLRFATSNGRLVGYVDPNGNVVMHGLHSEADRLAWCNAVLAADGNAIGLCAAPWLKDGVEDYDETEHYAFL